MIGQVPTVEEVYAQSGIPTYTFVKPTEYVRLLVAVRTKGRGLVVEGPSGIGKTTSIMKVVEELGLPITMLSARNPGDRELIAELPTLLDRGVVLIDDFHRLDDSVKASIADFMKTLADAENGASKIIIVGINKAGDSLVKFSSDLNNRIDTVKFEANPIERVLELIEKGEETLNISFDIKNEIAEEAQGSFHIAQMLCYETCIADGITERHTEPHMIHTSIETVKQRVFDQLSRVFFEKARAFATGSKLRREGRAPYLLILYWLAQANDWSLSLDEAIRENPNHRPSVGQVVDKGYLESLLRGDDLFWDVLHYDPVTKVISVEDPKFVYYLRNILWSKFARQVGYRSDRLSFDRDYDFALSFAGSDRDIAEAIFQGLTREEVSVFYDKNEQHRILAENVEDYLAPIYKSEAHFVIVLLGPDYPNRIWTRFESQQFVKRFGEGSVIPVWFAEAPSGMFDESRKYGGFSFDRNLPMDLQINEIVETLLRKLADVRQNDE